VQQRLAIKLQRLIPAPQPDAIRGAAWLDRIDEQLRGLDAGVVTPPAHGIDHRLGNDHRGSRFLDLDMHEGQRRMRSA